MSISYNTLNVPKTALKKFILLGKSKRLILIKKKLKENFLK